MKKITSRSNPLFQQMKDLRQQNLILIEGNKLCREAVSSDLDVQKVLLTEKTLALPDTSSLLDQINSVIPRIILTDQLMRKLTDTITPQGIALVCGAPGLEVPSLPEKSGLYLIADGLQDPGNLGTLIRTADAFSFSAVIITTGTVYPFNDKVIRSAMGSAFRVKLISFPDLAQAAAWLKTVNVTLLAADLQGEDSTNSDLPVPAALIIGNEANGLSQAALGLAERRISIPMPGRAESLNAAVAGAILSYEMMRSRRTRYGYQKERL